MIHFLLLLFLVNPIMANNMYLDSYNRFQNILVYISDNVPENGGVLLDRIKSYINSASMSLWKATNNLHPDKAGVQFGTVYIRIPQSWSTSSSPVTWQQCNKALFFIRINDMDKNTKPITKQLKKCGDPGQFSSFPQAFFESASPEQILRAGKEMMNEFVKLRYGVYSESPLNNFLYVFNGTNHVKGVCGSSIKWKTNLHKTKCSEPNRICNFTIIPNQNHNYSVMFDTETRESEYFCDDGKRHHNKYARNLHNIKCNMRSVTSVILDHADFADNKPLQNFQDADIKIVKSLKRKFVLVLDTSGSMSGIIDNMIKATVAFLESIEDSASVGLVDFNSVANIRSHLQSLEYSNNRENLINNVKMLKSDGWTNIPDGLAKGVEVLGGDIRNDDYVYGTIILLTDGQNNRNKPFEYDFVINQIIKKRISVNSIAYGTLADPKINHLTASTGGQYFYADPYKVYLDLKDKLSTKQLCEISIDHEIKVSEGNMDIQITERIHTSKLVYIDKFVGKNVRLSVTLPGNKSKYELTLISPSQKRYSSIEIIRQNQGNTFIFLINGKPELGIYSLEFKSLMSHRFKRSTDAFTVKFTVSAKPNAIGERIINPTGELETSEIKMLEDTTQVLATVDLTTCGILKSENVSVIMEIVPPSGIRAMKTMSDNGMGGDAVADDKIFSKILYAKDLEIPGFYDFKAQIEIKTDLDKEPIRRSVQFSSLRVIAKQMAPIQDKIPPSRIENVQLKLSDTKTKMLQISFLAPGNDGMVGSISQYEIMIKTWKIFTESRTNYAFSMQKVELIINLEQYNITKAFEISIRGIDENNNRGEWSQPETYNWEYMSVYEDKIPPSKITNINLELHRKLKAILIIRFPATGDDGKNGTISKYELKIHSSKQFLEERRSNVSTNQIVEFYLNLTKYIIYGYEISFEVLIRGVDDNNNKGAWSDPQIFKWDRIPPSRIENVSIQYNVTTCVLQVRFIAPGNNENQGTINKYEIMINFSKPNIEDKTGFIPSGRLVNFNLNLKKYNINDSFTVTVRGIDDSHNEGEWSVPQFYSYDKIPPATIKNVIISIHNVTEKTINIQFIAPGNDGNDGTINKYEIKVNFTRIIIEKRRAAVPSGKIVELYLYLKKYNSNKTIEISVRGIDDHNNYGRWSTPKNFNWDLALRGDEFTKGLIFLFIKLCALMLFIFTIIFAVIILRNKYS